MTDQHPSTPPDELRKHWAQQAQRIHPCDPVAWMLHVSTAASQWGWDQRSAATEAELQHRADQELEACLEHLSRRGFSDADILGLRAARRPKQPSKVDLALKSLEGMALPEDLFDTISREIQRLKELEAAND